MLSQTELPMIFEAIARHDIQRVENIITREGATVLQKAAGDFVSPLHAALVALATAGEFSDRAKSLLRLIIDKARTLGVLGDLINLADRNWNTPLTLALDAGHDDMVLLLLDCGADPELSGSKRPLPLARVIDDNRRALIWAFCAKHNRLLDLNLDGLPPIEYALQKKDYLAALDLLCLEHGFHEPAIVDGLLASDPHATLTIAERLAHPDAFLRLFKILLAAGQEDIVATILPMLFNSTVDATMRAIAPTLLCLAARRGSVALLTVLQKCEVPLTLVVDDNGQSIHPVDVAIEMGHMEAALWLLDHGADCSPAQLGQVWHDLLPGGSHRMLNRLCDMGARPLIERLLRGRKHAPAIILDALSHCRDIIFKEDDADLLNLLLRGSDGPVLVDDLFLRTTVTTAPYGCLGVLARAGSIRFESLNRTHRSHYLEQVLITLAEMTTPSQYTGTLDDMVLFAPALELLMLTDLTHPSPETAIYSVFTDLDLYDRWPQLVHLLAAIGALPHTALAYLLKGLKRDGLPRLCAHAALAGLIDYMDVVNDCKLQPLTVKAIADLPNCQQVIGHLRQAQGFEGLDDDSKKLLDICLAMIEKLITRSIETPVLSLLDTSLRNLARTPGDGWRDHEQAIETILPISNFLILHDCYRPGATGHLRFALIRHYLRQIAARKQDS